MTPKAKLIVRSISLVVVATLTAWAATNYSFTKAAAVAVLTALIQAVVEVAGPSSDVGIKWE